MYPPEEAIEELEHCTRQLGFKVAMFGSLVARPVDAIAIADAEAARFVAWYDTLGLDSEYDYDPLWARCAELGVVGVEILMQAYETLDAEPGRLGPVDVCENRAEQVGD